METKVTLGLPSKTGYFRSRRTVHQDEYKNYATSYFYQRNTFTEVSVSFSFYMYIRFLTL